MLLEKFGCDGIMARRYGAHGREVDICELEFKGSYGGMA